jgi:hypothetical protein
MAIATRYGPPNTIRNGPTIGTPFGTKWLRINTESNRPSKNNPKTKAIACKRRVSAGQLFVRMRRPPTQSRMKNAAMGSATAATSITPRLFGIDSSTANGARAIKIGTTPSHVISLRNHAEKSTRPTFLSHPTIADRRMLRPARRRKPCGPRHTPRQPLLFLRPASASPSGPSTHRPR